eukprot:13604110-Ditylum_brightwellii.AAC.1
MKGILYDTMWEIQIPPTCLLWSLYLMPPIPNSCWLESSDSSANCATRCRLSPSSIKTCSSAANIC